MTLLAALFVGGACALFAGALLGTLPEGRFRHGRVAARVARNRAWLQQAGLQVSPVRFWAACIGAGLVALLVFTAVTGSVVVGLVPAGVVAMLPRAYFGRRRRIRMSEVQRAWPDGLRDLVASMAAGRSLTQSVNALAANGPEPLRLAFARFPELARVLGTGPALEIVKEDLADPTSDRVLEVLLLAHERGGPIVRSILVDLTDATTRDLKLLDELDTESLEMRINARAVVVLPWLVLVALTARPGAFRDFYQSGAGVLTVAVAAVLSAVGVGVLGRLGRDQGEERVLARGSEVAA
jgi:tight adherence protein B